MWKDVLSRYNTSLPNSRVSGMHDNDLFSYYSGKIDVIYLHEWMKIKLGLANAVEGEIPKRARLDTFGASNSDDDSAPEEPHDAKQACKGKGRTMMQLMFLPSSKKIVCEQKCWSSTPILFN